MDNYAVTHPYQHVVYSSRLGNFDIDIDIEFDGGISTVLLSSAIGDVVFYDTKIQRVLDFETAKLYYMNDDLIQDILDLSNERLAVVQELIKE